MLTCGGTLTLHPLQVNAQLFEAQEALLAVEAQLSSVQEEKAAADEQCRVLMASAGAGSVQYLLPSGGNGWRMN